MLAVGRRWGRQLHPHLRLDLVDCR